jgi:cytochrome b561
VEKRIWWQEPNSVRIHMAITLATLWFFRLRTVYRVIKNAPKRSVRVRQIEVIVAATLWTFILMAVTALFLAGQFRG